MREILFRGKRVDNSEWAYGYYVHYDDIKDNKKDDTDYIIKKHNGEYFPFEEVISETVGQYTGLTDKNGKKIFEGDIVKGISYSTERHGVIVWIDKIASFGVKYWSRETPTAWNNSSILMQIQNGRKDEFAAEIIGNIYDNPELLRI